VGTINAWWSEQVWNDPNCRLNIYHDTIHNNNRDYRKEWFVNGALAYRQDWGQWENVPLPNTLSWRYPYGTTFEFTVIVYDFLISGMPNVYRDQAHWGPGAFPYPPTPPGAAAPQILVADAGVNRWTITVQGGGTNHQIFVADGANGEPLYASGGNPTQYTYQMPVGQRSATIRGRAYNTGAAGATGPIADSFYGLGSENTAPNAPGAPAWDKARVLQGANARLSWAHSDPNGDAQTGSEVQIRKLPSGGWESLGVVGNSTSYRDWQFTSPGDYQAQVRTRDWEGYFGPWSAAAQITVYKTQVRDGGTWEDAFEDYVRSGGLWIPTQKVKLPL
jgi:hypothetical protein